MLNVVCFTDQQLPSIRLMTSLGLYFDDVAIPLSYKHKGDSFLRLLATLPKAERDFITRNSSFYSKYKSLRTSAFHFINPLLDDQLVNGILDLYTELPQNINPEKFHFLSIQQHAYGMGYFYGRTDAFREEGNRKIILPFSYSGKNYAMPNEIMKDERFADIVASLLAIEAIQISLPDLQAVHPEEIMWAREKLTDELTPFRMSMYRLAKSIKSLIDEKSALDTMKAEATFLVKTTLLPDVEAFRERLIKEKKSFARRIIVKSLDALKLAVNYLVSPDPMKLATFTTQAVSGAIDYAEYQDKVRSLRMEAAVSYLAKLPDLFHKKRPT